MAAPTMKRVSSQNPDTSLPRMHGTAASTMPFQNASRLIISSMGMENPTVQAKKMRISHWLSRFIWAVHTIMDRGTLQNDMPPMNAPSRWLPTKLPM